MRYWILRWIFQEKIIGKFVRTYEAGGTPNPCIDCNRFMKFDKLLDFLPSSTACITLSRVTMPALSRTNRPAAGCSKRVWTRAGPELCAVHDDTAAACAHQISSGRPQQDGDPRAGGAAQLLQRTQARQPGYLLCAGRRLRQVHGAVHGQALSGRRFPRFRRQAGGESTRVLSAIPSARDAASVLRWESRCTSAARIWRRTRFRSDRRQRCSRTL